MALAPWCANEKWVFGIDAVTGKHYALVSGRARCPPALKRNIAWWFRNDFEQQLPDWYEPNLPLQQRLNDWAIRNPLQNANLFVWGGSLIATIAWRCSRASTTRWWCSETT
jgi:hypothetical protein